MQINLDRFGIAVGEFRDLGNGSQFDVLDDFIPGIPGITDSSENITALIQTIVRIPEAGMYTLEAIEGSCRHVGESPESRRRQPGMDCGAAGHFLPRWLVDRLRRTIWHG